ncbi:MAG TPA: ATP-binding cassette domain-containing protein [Mycobacteriales bacterium]|jgi:ABC-2 type transport system ATP-binding protein|nr:ATP-binding cassette domain-containing protein [Mycobacteriales bacterium]
MLASPAPPIAVRNLSKRYGEKLAVDALNFTVAPGRVTGFLGPNGAGKSTTMRLILGLDRPDGGSATIGDLPYAALGRPLRTVGALLEARALHPGRTAREHLRALAQTQGVGMRRVDAVLDLVGLNAVAAKRVKGFSLGMGQRLGIATALLGDPPVLMLDEPVNGLDPEGVRWIRQLLTGLAAEGRTILLSSHLMQEMAMTAQHLVVIGRGRLIADCTTASFIEQYAPSSVLVRTPDSARLAAELVAAGASVQDEPDGMCVGGMPIARIGELAARSGVVLHELSPQRASLEEAFMRITSDSVDYATSASSVNDRTLVRSYS